MNNYDYRLKKIEKKVKRKHTDDKTLDYKAKAESLVSFVKKLKRMKDKDFFLYPQRNSNMNEYEAIAWELAHVMRTDELACEVCTEHDVYPYLLAFGFDVVPEAS